MSDEATNKESTIVPLAEKPLHRRRSPHQDKQLDYTHQMRPVYGGRCRRINDRRLPRIERQRFRRAQEDATQAARYDEDAADELADTLRTIKRAHFVEGRDRRRIPLKKAIGLTAKEKVQIHI